MPPKKRDKEGETSKNQRSEAAKSDHDLFLQAFEKPTQIYRYLRVRNAASPIFLQRNLSYMRYRMSRSHKSRQNYELDSLLDKVAKSLVPAALRDGYMTITFLGFYDKKPGEAPKEPVKVETLLLKICHKKRKETTTPFMTVTVGTCYVPINPSEECPPPKAPTASISVEEFREKFGEDNNEDHNEVKSYHLLLRVYNASNASSSGSSSSDQDSGEPVPKRRRTSTSRDEVKIFGTDLVIYDKQKQCLLGDGDYELLLDEVAHPRTLPRKFPSWEQIGDISEDCNSFELFANGPTLKFKLEWSREQRSSFVDRPRLVPAREEEVLDNNGNKENRLDRAAKKQAGDKKDEEKKSGKKPVIVYQFHYNNNSRQQTEPCRDLHCPWCSLDCGTLFSLLKHLKLCHARFTFTYTPLPNMARIDVAINESYDGSYTGSPHDVIAQPGGSAFSRNGPQIRTTVSNILVCHPKRLKPSLSEFMELEEESGDLQRSFITGHNRLYHHTVTCLPVHPKEMENDSEGENDPKWLQTKTMMMIDEFTDVNEGEKELMKMWNLHVMKEGYVGDCQVPLACSKFLEKKGQELLDKNLYRNFVVHMCSLFDYGLVSPVVLYQTIQQLHEMISEPHAQQMQCAWEGQKEHWIKSGAKEKQNTPSHFKNQAPSAINSDPSARRKLYSPGSYKSESPSRRKTQQQEEDDEEDDEDDDEEDEEYEEDEETDKIGNLKSSGSSSSASSTSSESTISKKKSGSSASENVKRKSITQKSGSVPVVNIVQPKIQGMQSKAQVFTGAKSSLNPNSKPQTLSAPSNGDSTKRKAPSSRGASPSPGGSCKPNNNSVTTAANQNNTKNFVSAPNDAIVKKKIISTPSNGKPAGSHLPSTSAANELKRKFPTGSSISSASTSSGVTEPKKALTNGLPQLVGTDSKKRFSLPTKLSNGTKSAINVPIAVSVNCETSKKNIPNGIGSTPDGKLVSSCTVEMVHLSEEGNKVTNAGNNEAKRKSSLGPNLVGASSSQGDNGPQRRKSVCADSPITQEGGLVLLRRKSFSSNQSTESGPIQTLPPKGVAS